MHRRSGSPSSELPRDHSWRVCRHAATVKAGVLALFSVAVIALSACGRSRSADARVPNISFLVSAGDSTFWVARDRDRFGVRRSPMLLASDRGRFYELYLADDDRSFYDAVIVGQRVYRRDLVTGDSLALYQDTTIARLAGDYAAQHPNEAPLGPDEEAASDPSTSASTEMELLDVVGPYLTYEQHVDIHAPGDREQLLTRWGVIDIRDGRMVRVADLVGAPHAADVYRAGRRLFEAALDSVRRMPDERARRASLALSEFAFDSTSFSLVDDGGAPAIAFLVPGRGTRAGGYSLPLPPLRIDEGEWWAPVRAGLPTDTAGAATWRGRRYDVLVREDSLDENLQLIVRRGPNEWRVTSVPTPVRRVIRLDDPPLPIETLRALRRAFDESALYSGESRTALNLQVPEARSRPAATAGLPSGGSRAARGSRAVGSISRAGRGVVVAGRGRARATTVRPLRATTRHGRE